MKLEVELHVKPSESESSVSQSEQRGASVAQGRIALSPADFLGVEPRGAAGVFDLTGRSRRLLHGPHTRVEPGVWRARVRLEMSEDAGKRQIVLYFGVNPYSAIDLPYGAEGVHEVELDTLVTTTNEVEIWLWLKRAAFHGVVRLLSASIERVGDVSDWAAEPRPGAIRAVK